MKAENIGNKRLLSSFREWNPDTYSRFTIPSQTKDSHKQDILTSCKSTSPCTHAVEPPCTERYARWCERSTT